ncbi:hypothetical protein EJ02DRAFT_387755 [Clathrospora elynae]|uniref:Uncharacterized protein n=1 Tax=Clathrospora elynae TaxID=706981 RepID=A0A6A5S8Y3_9PLEO|nr:hypothetical protein EJ02DRAFT_387755 [Clathrospora elynae]
MHISTLLTTFVFTTFALAKSFPSAQPAARTVPTPAGGRSRNQTHHHHHERTPTFTTPCDCPKPIVPYDLLSANERCLMEQAAAMGCYLGSKGGCPSPAPACGLGPLPGLPLG